VLEQCIHRLLSRDLQLQTVGVAGDGSPRIPAQAAISRPAEPSPLRKSTPAAQRNSFQLAQRQHVLSGPHRFSCGTVPQVDRASLATRLRRTCTARQTFRKGRRASHESTAACPTNMRLRMVTTQSDASRSDQPGWLGATGHVQYVERHHPPPTPSPLRSPSLCGRLGLSNGRSFGMQSEYHQTERHALLSHRTLLLLGGTGCADSRGYSRRQTDSFFHRKKTFDM